MEEFKINIKDEFNDKLGGRWIELGDYSGEEFYNTLLEPRYKEAVEKNIKLHIYLDGTKGYGSSFLDQSFGELARIYGIDNVKSVLEFHTKDFTWNVKYLEEEIWGKS